MDSRLFAAIYHYMGIPVRDILSRKRTSLVSEARAMACYLMRLHTSMSMAEIGVRLGRTDHSTIYYHLHRMEKTMKISARHRDLAQSIYEHATSPGSHQ